MSLDTCPEKQFPNLYSDFIYILPQKEGSERIINNLLITEHNNNKNTLKIDSINLLKTILRKQMHANSRFLEKISNSQWENFITPINTSKIECKNINKKNFYINIMSSFTIDPIKKPLSFFMDKFCDDIQINILAYNQIFQTLADKKCSFFDNNFNINIIFFRLEDWFFYRDIKPSYIEIEQTLTAFFDALNEAITKIKNPLILVLCSHSPHTISKLDLTDNIDKIDAEIVLRYQKIQGLEILDLRDFAATDIYDQLIDNVSHIPYKKKHFIDIAYNVSRRIFYFLKTTCKVLVLDCDNTLWRGICAEDGHSDIIISNAYTQFQKMILQMKDSGILLAICSKNNESDVWDVFAKNPKMIIKRNDIIAYRINWDKKSENIRSLANELQLGIDSFIFIDDNPMECAEVKNSFPSIITVNLPTNEKKISFFLRHHWIFDQNKATLEDKDRTLLYKQNLERQKLQKTIKSFDEFISLLKIEVNIEKLSFDNIPRASQLTYRTNQFNATGIRLSEAQLSNMLITDNIDIYTVNVNDIYGSYGMVGLILAKQNGNHYVCENFLLSCRVLGKKVEHRMLSYLMQKAKHRKLEQIKLLLNYTERNTPVRDFYSALGNIYLLHDGEFYAAINLIPSKITKLLNKKNSNKLDHKMINNTINTNLSNKDQKYYSLNNLSDALNDIAHLQGDLDLMQSAINIHFQNNRPFLKKNFVSPKTALQLKIAKIWQEVLQIEKVGIYDDFYELGGGSLAAVEATVRMWEVGIPNNVSLFSDTQPTIASLINEIHQFETCENL